MSILSTRNVIWTLWGVGGGLASVTFLGENHGNFDSLFENFDILNSSIQSIQNPAFS